jgi:predicted transcriptional regulator
MHSKVGVCARIDAELVRRIDAIAAERRWSRSTLIVATLERLAAEHAEPERLEVRA